MLHYKTKAEMIKLFRKIRQQLLSENTVSKPASPAGRYLLYAIGEIILVVIGILIALQINNANEDRKKRISEQIILKALKEDFLVNQGKHQNRFGTTRLPS